VQNSVECRTKLAYSVQRGASSQERRRKR